MREHELIREIRALLRPGPGRALGAGVIAGAEAGDDCAVLAPEPGRELLFTTDAAVEGVHFDLAWMT
ncbi:MAG TPA: hypothetical protein VHF22_03350, partial [Planctomycetota bacterium]|nr:hypothetical protein [Planctomycetota bacterium]